MKAQHSGYGSSNMEPTTALSTTLGEAPGVDNRPLLPRSPSPEPHPSLEGLEERWSATWEDAGTYRFDRNRSREEIYSIDTPPPTVSGSLHIGHVLSYTHTDCVARFQRMRGKAVFYPMGWDDNGVPTERRVQNYYNVRCDPSLPYDPSAPLPVGPAPKDAGPPIALARPAFITLCHELTRQDERAFEELWRFLGLSVDWSQTYATIGPRAQRISQKAFLALVRTGRAYQNEAPTLWDVDFHTAVSQAELEDREIPGAYHRLAFPLMGPRPEGFESDHVEIETTRPELLPACVALVAHPDDSRYKPLFGARVLTPLFEVPVPVVAHELADPEKGSGIAMICTFGDVTDVTWWRELKLPTRVVLGRDGRLVPIQWASQSFPSQKPELASACYARLQGKRPEAARKEIVELLSEHGALVGEPKPIRHAVRFFEKGEHPLEIVSSRQWFIRILDLKQELLERGRELIWHPEHMRARYEAWVNGLASDWNVSRQRFFGVPVPLWYPIDQTGKVLYEEPILPEDFELPVDPLAQAPKGYDPSTRDQPGGFTGDPDVLDTWATSSLTPQIAGGWGEDEELFQRVFPMDLRPQGQDIIRTWLFSTVVRSHLGHGCLPWKHAAISGFVLDPDRKKMSKSKGNVVTPLPLLKEHGADAVRYWAAMGRPGVDTAVDMGQMKVGRRLATKILNASRFALERVSAAVSDPKELADLAAAKASEQVDLDWLSRLADVVDISTGSLEAYDYTRALEHAENAFWEFCDDYLELVKARAYGEGPSGNIQRSAQQSALVALATSISVFTRLFAPFLPFVTEEVWSWWQEGSIHLSPWPTREEVLSAMEAPPGLASFVSCSQVLSIVRKAKTQAKSSMRAPVEKVLVRCETSVAEAIRAGQDDLRSAGAIEELLVEPHEEELADSPVVEVTLAPREA
jgi:valyl-tRNA synthetase